MLRNKRKTSIKMFAIFLYWMCFGIKLITQPLSSVNSYFKDEMQYMKDSSALPSAWLSPNK